MFDHSRLSLNSEMNIYTPEKMFLILHKENTIGTRSPRNGFLSRPLQLDIWIHNKHTAQRRSRVDA